MHGIILDQPVMQIKRVTAKIIYQHKGMHIILYLIGCS